LKAKMMKGAYGYSLKGGDFANAGRISTSIKRQLKENDYPGKIIQRVAIVTYESEINVASYAQVGYFFVYFNEQSVKIVIKDRGSGIQDVRLAMQEGFSTASDEVRRLGFGAGMGLPNIKKYAHKLTINSKPGTGTRLCIYVNLEKSGKGAGTMAITMQNVLEKSNFTLLNDSVDLSQTVSGGYVGDMLSDVNANGRKGNIWITMLTHPNAIAVASLKDFAGIIITGGIQPADDYIKRAAEEGIPVLFTELSSYEAVILLSSMGVEGNH